MYYIADFSVWHNFFFKSKQKWYLLVNEFSSFFGENIYMYSTLIITLSKFYVNPPKEYYVINNEDNYSIKIPH